MKRPALALILALAGAMAPCPALAEQHRCAVPLADWQPRQALYTKLEAEGWRDIRVRVDDGCYKVRAVNDLGERLDAKFDPATLTALPRGGRAGHDGAPHD